MTIAEALRIMEAKGKELKLPMLETLEYCQANPIAMSERESKAFCIVMAGFRAMFEPA